MLQTPIGSDLRKVLRSIPCIVPLPMRSAQGRGILTPILLYREAELAPVE